jgi:RNA polymerase sigma factor (sigma-70 family)
MLEGNSAPAPVDGDAEIVRLMNEREATGLRMLLTVHGARARAGLKRRFGGTLSEGEIDEALNTATFRAWRGVHTYDPGKGSLRAWFFVIASNASREIVRARRRHEWQLRGEDVEQIADRPDPAELTPMPPPAFLETLRRCIDALPRLQRSIIEADLQNGDTADAAELAKLLDTTKNSIYVSRSLARKALRRALGDLGCFADPNTNKLQWK